jgi:hypothetical protein
VNGQLVDTKVKAKDIYADHPVDGVTLNTAGFYTVIKDGEYVVGAAVAPSQDANYNTLYSSYVGISFKGATDKEVVIAGANEEGYTWTAKTVVAYVTLDSKGFATPDTAVTSVDKITADANDLVWIVPNKAIPTQADAIYIVAVDDSANTAQFYTTSIAGPVVSATAPTNKTNDNGSLSIVNGTTVEQLLDAADPMGMTLKVVTAAGKALAGTEVLTAADKLVAEAPDGTSYNYNLTMCYAVAAPVVGNPATQNGLTISNATVSMKDATGITFTDTHNVQYCTAGSKLTYTVTSPLPVAQLMLPRHRVLLRLA